ncbi:S-layer homology domain-containing protein [Cohnella sp. 56]|uniref:S-layer homology domain-containing protein n=1 Tax=Cohnella sp. 56 TaxID=3113722 RepID=UPI0030E7A23B
MRVYRKFSLIAICLLVCSAAIGWPAGRAAAAGALKWENVHAPIHNAYTNIVGLTSVTYGDGKYVAVGESATITTSTDGVTWTGVIHNLSVTEKLVSVAYGNNMYVAIGTSGAVVYSSNALSWTKVSTGISGGLYEIQYLNGKFWATGANGLLMSSDNGTTWTKNNAIYIKASTAELTSIGYGGGKYIVGDIAGKVYESTDGGATWSGAKSILTNTANIASIRMMNGQFFVTTGSTNSYRSADGTSWTSIGTTDSIIDSDYGNGKYVLMGYGENVYTSTDGIAFTKQIRNGTSTTRDVVFGDGKFVAVGDGGIIAYSTDGIAWTVATPLILDMLENNGLYVAVVVNNNSLFSASGAIMTSSDLRHWTVRLNTVSGVSFSSIAYSGQKYVAVGKGGKIYTSLDAYSWSPATPVTTEDLSGVDYVNGRFMAGSTKGTYLTSTDGSVWVKKTFPSQLSNSTIKSFAYGNGVYIAVGTRTIVSQVAYQMAYSTDGVNWTAVSMPGISVNLNDVVYGDNLFVAVGSNSYIFSSPDGLTWTERKTTSGIDLTTVAYGAGYYVAAGYRNTILSSPNGQTWTAESPSVSVYVTNALHDGSRFVMSGYSATIMTASTSPPSFTSQPTDKSVQAGESTSLEAQVTGAWTYQWQVKQAPSTTFVPISNNGTYSGATTATLSINAATAGMNGNQYRLVTKGAISSETISDVATLSVAAPVAVPGAPTGVTATAGDGRAEIGFTAPASDGGSAITLYTVTASPGGATATGTASPITVTGLTNGTAYTFTVTAKNAAGDSAASAASAGVTPAAPEATPAAEIDYVGEKLTGLVPGEAYTVNGTSATADASGKLALEGSWIGTTLSIVKKGNGTNLADSAAQSLAVPSRAAAPTGVGKTDESYPGAGDGTLTGVTNELEYKLNSDSGWTSITGTKVENLLPGTYEVRTKATATTFATVSVTVTIASVAATPETTPAAEVDYVGEKLTGLVPNGKYTVNGMSATADASGKLALEGSWIGTTLSIVKKGNGTNLADSALQSLAVPSRAAAPTGVGKTDESYPGAGDGTLTGVTNELEYKLSADSGWTSITGTKVENLLPGTYEVRTKATATTFATVSVTVTIASVAATPETTPAAEVDYVGEKLTGLVPNGKYTVNGMSATADASGKLALEGSWIGTTLSIVKKGNGTNLADSALQSLAVPSRAAAPTGVGKTDESYPGAGDGTLTGVTNELEYKLSSDSGWTSITGTKIENLLPGTYEVRTKATATTFATVSVTVTIASVAATPEVTPAAEIDYVGEKLTGLTPNGKYTVNGASATANASGELALEGSWIGTTLAIVKKGNGTNLADSAAQSLAVPSRAAAPTGVNHTDESYPGAGDGTLTGVTDELEYKLSSDSGWTSITGTKIENLLPGTYEVRTKATATTFATVSVTVTIASVAATPEVTPAAEIDYVGEKLTGLTPNGKYTVNGASATANASGELALEGSWIGTTLAIVKKGNGTNLADSAAQSLAVPSRAAAPTGVNHTDESYPGAGDGTLTGVTNELEYKLNSDSTWTSITGTTVANLLPGTYEVRTKATATTFATASVTVTIASVAATPETTPAAEIDYVGEKLTGLTPNGKYTVNGTSATADARGELALEGSWIGTTLAIVKKGNGTNLADSAAQSLAVPSRAAAPTGVNHTDESYPGAGDGTLTGVTNELEYKLNSDSTWTSITGTTVANLLPGTYEVRTKATATTFATASVTVTIASVAATPETTPAAEIDYVGEKLTGLTPNGKYTVNGTSATANASGELALEGSWIGTTLSIVKKGNGTNLADSAAQSLAVPSRATAPTGVNHTDVSYPGAGNGTLTGVTSEMEYKLSADSGWTSITGTTVANLLPGTYEVRTKATATTFATESVTVTLSGTPATPEVTPTAEIDYVGEKLTGLTPNGKYTVNGTSATANASGELALEGSWIGTTLSIVKKGNGTNLADSAAQSLAVPSRATAPTGVNHTDESYPGAGDGTLTGVTSEMEYKLSADSGWTSITGTTVANLLPGTYEVRTKATATTFATESVTVTLSGTPATPEVMPTAEIDYVGEKLTGLTPNGKYTVNGTIATADGSGELALAGDWIGQTLSIVKQGNGKTTADSSAQSLVVASRPAAPEVAADDVNNAILHLDMTMEYAMDGGPFVRYDGASLPDLSGAHTVKVRLAATGSRPAGATVTISFTTNPVNPSYPNDVTIPANTEQAVEVWVNGKAENAGKASTSEVEGIKTTRIAVDPDRLQRKLEAEGRHAVVTIPVRSSSDVIVGELGAQTVKNMQELEATLVIQTDRGSYTLPSRQINLDDVARQLGGQSKLADITIEVTIAETTNPMQQLAARAAADRGFTVIAPPVDFKVAGTYGGKTIEITRFTAYVQRTVALPQGIDPSKITTGVVVEADGSVRHVPTQVQIVDGVYYAVINSLTNSTYGVIWNSLAFADMERHWAQGAVNDMASRLVVNGISETSFNPDADVTRAEFAAIIVRGLGLKLNDGANPFNDVTSGSWYEGAIRTAAAYGLIAGFADGTFRPNEKLTREQAMTMLSRAMEVTGLTDKLAASPADATLQMFEDAGGVSAWARSGVSYSVQAGIVSGRSAHKLAPKANMTRAEVAAIVQRLLQQSGLI